MFNNLIKKLLEDFNIYPRSSANISQGPNIDFKGVTPAGFLGGGLPGINPSSNALVVKPKTKKIKTQVRS